MRLKCQKRLYDRLRGPIGWHEWFAWYPVWAEQGEYVWLELVERHLDAYYGNEYRSLSKGDSNK